MKLKWALVTLLLLFALSPPLVLAAEQAGSIRQVSYELVIFELAESDAKILGLSVAEPLDFLEAGVTAVTRLVHSPGLIQILRAGTELFRISASQRQEQSVRVAQPQITVAVGETGKFALASEEWIRQEKEGAFAPRHFGLELLLTPLRVDRGGEQIFTSVELGTATAQGILTTVWTKAGELEPIGVLTFLREFEKKGLLSSSRGVETRFFAVYLKASATAQLSPDPSVAVGSLGGLPALFWPEEIRLKPSSAALTLPLKPLAPPELEISWWLSGTVKLGVSTSSHPRTFQADLGLALARQELLLHAQLLGSASQTFFTLGIADQVEILPDLTVSAGIYPLVVDLRQRKLERTLHWWAQVELCPGKSYGSFKYESQSGSQSLEGRLGYRWAPQDTIFLHYKTDLKDRDQFGVGYRKEF